MLYISCMNFLCYEVNILKYYGAYLTPLEPEYCEGFRGQGAQKQELFPCQVKESPHISVQLVSRERRKYAKKGYLGIKIVET